MKITRLKTWQVPPRWLFLKIETDEGCYGWGEPVIEGRAATVEAAVHELADYLSRVDRAIARPGPPQIRACTISALGSSIISFAEGSALLHDPRSR